MRAESIESEPSFLAVVEQPGGGIHSAGMGWRRMGARVEFREVASRGFRVLGGFRVSRCVWFCSV